MGKGGPLIILKFILPGLVIDSCAAIYPGLPFRYSACAVVGAFAALTRFVSIFIVELALGMEAEMILGHALISSIGNFFFGALGGAIVPVVARKLKAHSLID